MSAQFVNHTLEEEDVDELEDATHSLIVQTASDGLWLTAQSHEKDDEKSVMVWVSGETARALTAYLQWWTSERQLKEKQ